MLPDLIQQFDAEFSDYDHFGLSEGRTGQFECVGANFDHPPYISPTGVRVGQDWLIRKPMKCRIRAVGNHHFCRVCRHRQRSSWVSDCISRAKMLGTSPLGFVTPEFRSRGGCPAADFHRQPANRLSSGESRYRCRPFFLAATCHLGKQESRSAAQSWSPGGQTEQICEWMRGSQATTC